MDTALQILSILEKRKYSRRYAPQDERIKENIQQSIESNTAIQLIGFWGIGQKDKRNWADEESCAFLNELNEEIKQIYPPGIEFTFIFATKHAEHNGYSVASVNSYIQSITELMDNYSFKHLSLDTLWTKYHIDFEKIDSMLATKEQDWWDNISERDVIEKNASHRNKKYDPKLAAQKYYIMRNLEKEMLEKEFPNYIFHAFSDPKLKDVLPNMPTLYFWGTKQWHSNAPWFIG